MASGVGSVAFKDVLAETIPKGKRGRLLVARATLGGLLTLVAGSILRLYIVNSDSQTPYLILIAGAAVLWGIASVCFALINERKGATEGGRNAVKKVSVGFRLIREVPGFRRFIIARAFQLSMGLSLPLNALYARDVIGASIGGLGVFVIANGVSNIFSSPLWGRFVDPSIRGVMTISSLLAAATGVIALLMGLVPEYWQGVFVFAPVFLIIGFSQARLGLRPVLTNTLSTRAEALPEVTLIRPRSSSISTPSPRYIGSSASNRSTATRLTSGSLRPPN